MLVLHLCIVFWDFLNPRGNRFAPSLRQLEQFSDFIILIFVAFELGLKGKN